MHRWRCIFNKKQIKFVNCAQIVCDVNKRRRKFNGKRESHQAKLNFTVQRRKWTKEKRNQNEFYFLSRNNFLNFSPKDDERQTKTLTGKESEMQWVCIFFNFIFFSFFRLEMMRKFATSQRNTIDKTFNCQIYIFQFPLFFHFFPFIHSVVQSININLVKNISKSFPLKIVCFKVKRRTNRNWTEAEAKKASKRKRTEKWKMKRSKWLSFSVQKEKRIDRPALWMSNSTSFLSQFNSL